MKMTKLHKMRTIALAASAMALSQVSTAANATALYIIDNFATAQSTAVISGTGTVTYAGATGTDPFTATLDNIGSTYTSTTTGPYSIGGYGFTRDLKFTVTDDTATFSPAQKAKLTLSSAVASPVTPAKLGISNGSSVNSKLELTYNIQSLASLMLPGADATFAVFLSDSLGTPGAPGLNGSPTSISMQLDGYNAAGQVGSSIVPLNQVYNNGTNAGVVHFTLPLSMIGGMDMLKFTFTGPVGYDLTISAIGVEIPEPAMLGLFGFGVLGLGIARRRKR